MWGLALSPTWEQRWDERVEAVESQEAYQSEIDLTEWIKEQALKISFARDTDILFWRYTYYGTSHVADSWYLLSSSQYKDAKNFWTDLAHLSVTIHRVFDSHTIERFSAFRVATEEKRRLSSQEQKYYEFFSQIEGFLATLDEIIQELADIDFERIKTQWYYSPKEWEEEYARQVKEKFDNFKNLIVSAGEKYDFLATIINWEFKEEDEKVTAGKWWIRWTIWRVLWW